MDYKKKKLDNLSCKNTYEEIDTRLATGWYVDAVGKNKTKKYKTKEVSFKISKKQIKWITKFLSFQIGILMFRCTNCHTDWEKYRLLLDFLYINSLS